MQKVIFPTLIVVVALILSSTLLSGSAHGNSYGKCRDIWTKKSIPSWSSAKPSSPLDVDVIIANIHGADSFRQKQALDYLISVIRNESENGRGPSLTGPKARVLREGLLNIAGEAERELLAREIWQIRHRLEVDLVLESGLAIVQLSTDANLKSQVIKFATDRPELHRTREQRLQIFEFALLDEDMHVVNVALENIRRLPSLGEYLEDIHEFPQFDAHRIAQLIAKSPLLQSAHHEERAAAGEAFRRIWQHLLIQPSKDGIEVGVALAKYRQPDDHSLKFLTQAMAFADSIRDEDLAISIAEVGLLKVAESERQRQIYQRQTQIFVEALLGSQYYLQSRPYTVVAWHVAAGQSIINRSLQDAVIKENYLPNSRLHPSEVKQFSTEALLALCLRSQSGGVIWSHPTAIAYRLEIEEIIKFMLGSGNVFLAPTAPRFQWLIDQILAQYPALRLNLTNFSGASRSHWEATISQQLESLVAEYGLKLVLMRPKEPFSEERPKQQSASPREPPINVRQSPFANYLAAPQPPWLMKAREGDREGSHEPEFTVDGTNMAVELRMGLGALDPDVPMPDSFARLGTKVIELFHTGQLNRAFDLVVFMGHIMQLHSDTKQSAAGRSKPPTVFNPWLEWNKPARVGHRRSPAEILQLAQYIRFIEHLMNSPQFSRLPYRSFGDGLFPVFEADVTGLGRDDALGLLYTSRAITASGNVPWFVGRDLGVHLGEEIFYSFPRKLVMDQLLSPVNVIFSKGKDSVEHKMYVHGSKSAADFVQLQEISEVLHLAADLVQSYYLSAEAYQAVLLSKSRSSHREQTIKLPLRVDPFNLHLFRYPSVDEVIRRDLRGFEVALSSLRKEDQVFFVNVLDMMFALGPELRQWLRGRTPHFIGPDLLPIDKMGSGTWATTETIFEISVEHMEPLPRSSEPAAAARDIKQFLGAVLWHLANPP